MVNLSSHELRLIAEKGAIKNYRNMSREKLESNLDKWKLNFQSLSEKGLERNAKMHNLSQNELDQITKKCNTNREMN